MPRDISTRLNLVIDSQHRIPWQSQIYSLLNRDSHLPLRETIKARHIGGDSDIETIYDVEHRVLRQFHHNALQVCSLLKSDLTERLATLWFEVPEALPQGKTLPYR